MLKKKQRLYKQARKTNKWTNYSTFQKECKHHLRKAEWDYVSTNIIEGLNNNNTKPFWKYVKSKRQESGGLQSLCSSPVSKEHCSMVFSIGARCIAHYFSIRFGILSGPDAFDGFMYDNSFSRPF
jgi:hypothetical protein